MDGRILSTQVNSLHCDHHESHIELCGLDLVGILDREQEQSVVYGSIDFGKTVVVDKKYQELLQKTAQVRKSRACDVNVHVRLHVSVQGNACVRARGSM